MAGDRYTEKRLAMVKQQIQERGIRDETLLQAMREVPRHLFVPHDNSDLAYADQAIGLGEGKSISQPYVVACMLEKLKLDKEAKVLDIGTGSGYQTAILAKLTRHVYTIEIDDELFERSRALLLELGYENISFRLGDGNKGWKEFAPYDAIILSAACEKVPRDLVDQMKDGGRMILPLGKDSQSLVCLSKANGEIQVEEMGAVQFVKMQNIKSEDLQ